jgi:hypothetical protein
MQKRINFAFLFDAGNRAQDPMQSKHELYWLSPNFVIFVGNRLSMLTALGSMGLGPVRHKHIY